MCVRLRKKPPESRSAVMAQQGCFPSMASLFPRRRCRGASDIEGNNDAYKLAARARSDEDQLQLDVNEFGAAALFEEEGLGPEALEARGDGFAATARRRSSSWRFRAFKGDDAALVIADDFKEAALAYVLAGNWRKAASAFGNQAVQILKVCPDPDRELDLHAAFAFLRSARCYRKIPEKCKDALAAARIAFEKAISLYIEGKASLKAAKSCMELAEFYEEQEWVAIRIIKRTATARLEKWDALLHATNLWDDIYNIHASLAEMNMRTL